MQEKHQKRLFWAIIATETSHVICCVLTTLFSVMSVLAGLGVVATMPGWLDSLLDVMHDWEIHAIILSASVVAIGWGLHYYSLKNDCHDHGCEHEQCGPRTLTASRILVDATILLAFNVTIYFGFHRPMEATHTQDVHEHMHHDHHAHGHDH